MITVKVGDIEVECESIAEAKKVTARLLREKRDLEKKASAQRDIARGRAEQAGYKVFRMFAQNVEAHRAYRLYTPGQKWAEHLFKPMPQEYSHVHQHMVNTENLGGIWVKVEHYGQDLVGAVCNGACYCMVLFLQDRSNRSVIKAYAVGSEGDQVYLADLPGITMDQFNRKETTNDA